MNCSKSDDYDDSKTKKDKQKNEKVDKTANYTLDTQNTKVKCTAYRYPSKNGVEVTFKKFTVTKLKPTKGVKASILNKAEFKVSTKDLDTGNATRNSRIVNYFFKNMLDTDYITGTLTITDDKKGVVDLTMNQKTEKLNFDYTIKDNIMDITVEKMNIDNWNVSRAFTAFSNICNAVHQGKTWKDVDIKLKIAFKKEGSSSNSGGDSSGGSGGTGSGGSGDY